MFEIFAPDNQQGAESGRLRDLVRLAVTVPADVQGMAHRPRVDAGPDGATMLRPIGCAVSGALAGYFLVRVRLGRVS